MTLTLTRKAPEQTKLAQLDRDIAAAEQALAELKRQRIETFYKALAIRHAEEGKSRAAAERDAEKLAVQTEVDALKARGPQSTRERLTEIERTIKARESERERHTLKGNQAAVAALAIQLARLDIRRRAITAIL